MRLASTSSLGLSGDRKGLAKIREKANDDLRRGGSIGAMRCTRQYAGFLALCTVCTTTAELTFGCAGHTSRGGGVANGRLGRGSGYWGSWHCLREGKLGRTTQWRDRHVLGSDQECVQPSQTMTSRREREGRGTRQDTLPPARQPLSTATTGRHESRATCSSPVSSGRCSLRHRRGSIAHDEPPAPAPTWNPATPPRRLPSAGNQLSNAGGSSDEGDPTHLVSLSTSLPRTVVISMH